MAAPNVYEEFDRATGRLAAHAIFKGSQPVGRIVFKHGGSCRAFVQVWGAPMVIGRAFGGGYDRETESVRLAVAAMHPPAADILGPRAAPEIERWRVAMSGDSGEGWRHRLESAGYTVQHVTG